MLSRVIVRANREHTIRTINIFKGTSHFVRRISLLLLFAICYLLLVTSATPVNAQESTPSALPSSNLQPPTSIPLPSYIPPTSPLFTDMLVYNIFHSFSCLGIGQSVIGAPCLNYIQGVPYLSSVNTGGGLLGTTTNLIGMLYANPPVRTADYLASVGKGLGIVKEANAQVGGSGAAVLSPIYSLWQVSRNISYVLMIIIFVIIGLMVMFRQRINPQTVITAQAALPGLVIGLIMITLSYFLAGLISDTAFVGTNVVGYYFGAARGDTSQNLVSDISGRNVFSIFVPFTKTIGQGDVTNFLSSIWNDLGDPTDHNPFNLDPQKVLRLLTGFITSQLLSPFAGLAGGWSQITVGIISATGAALAPVQMASFALSFIAMAILIYTMFKLLLRLISAFVTIIFLTITAPFQFLMAALPGRQGIATGWILNMLGNILIFPAVLAVLYFVAFLLGPDNNINKNCVPPCAFIISESNQSPGSTVYAQGTTSKPTGIIGKQSFPLFGGLDLNFINLLLVFGALIALPKIPDLVVAAVGKAGQAGQMIGQEISGSTAAGRGYAGQFQQGVGGIAQQVGRVTDEPGHIYKSGVGWERVTPQLTGVDEKDIARSGARPGLGTRIKGIFGR